MNRTKEELLKHAATTGYTKSAILKISGFLIGVGMKDESEIITWKVGTNTWDSFYAWFNGSTLRPRSVFDTIMEDIFSRLDASESEDERQRYNRQIEWMCKHHINIIDKTKKRENRR